MHLVSGFSTKLEKEKIIYGYDDMVIIKKTCKIQFLENTFL